MKLGKYADDNNTLQQIFYFIMPNISQEIDVFIRCIGHLTKYGKIRKSFFFYDIHYQFK